MFLTFHMCAKSLKAYDFAKIQGLSGVGLEQFLNVTLVMARRYYWSGIRRGSFDRSLANVNAVELNIYHESIFVSVFCRSVWN